MRTVLQRRPPAPMVISLVALVVAMSGTAVAASNLVNGDTLIKKGTLSGNRLRRHTLTGSQINLSKLGTVPNARSAGTAGYTAHAGSADTATNAANAAHATTAGNAAALGGQPAASFLTTASRVGTNGIVEVTGTSAGSTVTLFTSGPFTVTLSCKTIGSDTRAGLSVSSAEAGADLGYTFQDVAADTSDELEHLGPEPVDDSYNPMPLALEAPSGAQVVATGAFGIGDVSGPGTCWANFAGIA
jgi:hypothetical protein